MSVPTYRTSSPPDCSTTTFITQTSPARGMRWSGTCSGAGSAPETETAAGCAVPAADGPALEERPHVAGGDEAVPRPGVLELLEHLERRVGGDHGLGAERLGELPQRERVPGRRGDVDVRRIGSRGRAGTFGPGPPLHLPDRMVEP